MKKILPILVLSTIVYFFYTSTSYNKTPKIDQYIEITNIEKLDSSKLRIDYKLKDNLDKQSGLTKESLIFKDSKNNTFIVNQDEGDNSIVVDGDISEITIVYNANNRYKEEKIVKF